MPQHASRTAARILLFSTMHVSTAGSAFSAGWAAAQIEAFQIRQDVQRALSGERDLRPIEVSVEPSSSGSPRSGVFRTCAVRS